MNIEYLDSKFNNIFNSCLENDKMISALKSYTSDSGGIYSDYLLDTKKFFSKKAERIENNLEYIRRAINLYRIDEPLTVYHGTCSQILGGVNLTSFLEHNNIIFCKTFLSTSLYRSIGIDYSNSKAEINEGTARLLFEINLPEGYPALWVKPISKFKDEHELLLLDGISLKVEEYEKWGNFQKVIVKPLL